MIVNINKGGFAKGLIEYHEHKVADGKAIRLLDNTYSEDTDKRIHSFLDTASLNPSVRKNKFMHISVSFTKEDGLSVDSKKMLTIGERYLQEMGFIDVPVLIYEHGDKSHVHFHIVTTTMDNSGKKIPEFNDHYRSQQLSRKLEKEFGLVETIYQSKEERKLSEINSARYRILTGIVKGAPIFIQDLQRYLSEDQIEEIKRDKISDKDIANKYLIRGQEELQIAQLYRLLKKNDLFYTTKKDKLKQRLLHIKSTSGSKEEYFKNIEKEGLYVRKIATSNNAYSLTYGIGEEKFYVKEKDLPVSLRYDYLFTNKKLSLSFDSDQQRKYLKRVIAASLRTSNSIKTFEHHLRENNIELQYSTNARGIYGVSFSSNNVVNPITFKGSEISRDLSWNNLQRTLNVTPSPTITKSPDIESKSPSSNAITDLLKAARNTSKASDSEEKERKRKREQDERDNQKDF